MIISSELFVVSPTFLADFLPMFLASLDLLIVFLLLSHVCITTPCSSSVSLING